MQRRRRWETAPRSFKVHWAHLTFLQFLINTGLQPGGEGGASPSRFNGLAEARSDSPAKTVETVGFHTACRHPTEVGC
jgi:hypothetical protein